MISDRTLWEYLQNDIGWEFYTGRFKVKWLAEKLLLRDHHNNNFLLGQVKKESALYNGRPRFIYGHFYMPHPPFFCDSTGRLRTSEELKNLQKKDYASQYLQYVQYTNTKIKELIQTIKQNTHGTAVIVFMGDHGFRQTTNPGNLFNYFQNQNAVYFPGHDYAALPDSICTVNEFRIIFNTMFDAHLPLLNDSTIFLTNTYKFSQ
ncbi:MAG: sulfatase-like hydrolase/transferase [Bacteroidetes bacterium]|nr:sulfatase-like hydrolase/transferase [Bacteroidota bacterium]